MAIKLIGGESEYFARRKLASLTAGNSTTRTVYADEVGSGSIPELSGGMGLFAAATQQLVLVGALANPALRDLIVDNYDSIAANLDLILYENGKLDKRSKLYKKLSAQGAILEYPLESEGERKSELRQILRDAKLQVPGEVEQDLFWRLLPMPLPQAVLELSKLIHLAGKQGKAEIDKQDIAIITQDINLEIWELLTLAAKNKKSAYALLDNLELQQVQQQQILGFLAQQLRQLLNYYYAPSSIPAFIKRRLGEISQKITLPRLKQLISKLADLDEKSKTGRLDPQFAVRTFVALV
jgi:DNA polymerase III delta subunit